MGILYRRKKTDKLTGERVESGPYWMKYYVDGRPEYRSTGTKEKRKAQAVLTKAEANGLEGRRDNVNLGRIRFDDLVSLIKADYEHRGLKTWSRREQHIAHLKTTFRGSKAKSINSQLLQDYIKKRKGEGASNATINRELDCLHRMMVLGTQQTPPLVGDIPHFPRLVEDNVREGFFEHDEFLALRRVAPDHLKVALTIGYYTGMRLGEIITQKGLRWDQVNLMESTIRLTANQTKTKKPRVIYMEGDFYLAMLNAKELHDKTYPACPYVCHRNGKPVKEVRTAWKTACRLVGLEGKKFHDLRRTGARNLVRAGVPETVAMKISGHKTRAVFDRYNITSEDDLKTAATRLNEYTQRKMVTFTVTPEQHYVQRWKGAELEGIENEEKYMELARGIEPPTGGLQNRCSTN